MILWPCFNASMHVQFITPDQQLTNSTGDNTLQLLLMTLHITWRIITHYTFDHIGHYFWVWCAAGCQGAGAGTKPQLSGWLPGYMDVSENNHNDTSQSMRQWNKCPEYLTSNMKQEISISSPLGHCIDVPFEECSRS